MPHCGPPGLANPRATPTAKVLGLSFGEETYRLICQRWSGERCVPERRAELVGRCGPHPADDRRAQSSEEATGKLLSRSARLVGCPLTRFFLGSQWIDLKPRGVAQPANRFNRNRQCGSKRRIGAGTRPFVESRVGQSGTTRRRAGLSLQHRQCRRTCRNRPGSQCLHALFVAGSPEKVSAVAKFRGPCADGKGHGDRISHKKFGRRSPGKSPRH
jgi:hypothetical protein